MVNIRPYIYFQYFKILLLPQITFNFFKLLLNFLVNGPQKVLFWIIENFANLNFTSIFQFSLTQDPMGVKISQPDSPLKSLLNYSKLLLNSLLHMPHKRTVSDV